MRENEQKLELDPEL